MWRDLLERFEFDGVNVAELYYSSLSVPAHPSAVAQFGSGRAREGDAWLRFRRELVTRLDREIVQRVRSLDPSLDVVLTVIDDTLDPKLAERIGSDVSALAQVARDTGASLQIEDPYTTWTRGPARYVVLDRRVAGLGRPRRTFLDVNVVRREYAYPTPTMTGAELDLSVAAAGRTSGRIALYSAATLTAGALGRVPGALRKGGVDGGRPRAPAGPTRPCPRATAADRRSRGSSPQPSPAGSPCSSRVA